jgi:hypothetical protein
MELLIEEEHSCELATETNSGDGESQSGISGGPGTAEVGPSSIRFGKLMKERISHDSSRCSLIRMLRRQYGFHLVFGSHSRAGRA